MAWTQTGTLLSLSNLLAKFTRAPGFLSASLGALASLFNYSIASFLSCHFCISSTLPHQGSLNLLKMSLGYAKSKASIATGAG